MTSRQAYHRDFGAVLPRLLPLTRKSLEIMVGGTGIEPVTPAMSTPRNQRKSKSFG